MDLVQRCCDFRLRCELIGASQPIVATLGDDITLPCHLKPAQDVSELTTEWTRPDLNPRFVHVWRAGQELVEMKHKSFKGRTTLFTEELQRGNVSLRLSRVRLSDKGTYRCYIPTMEKQTNIHLVVGEYTHSLLVMHMFVFKPLEKDFSLHSGPLKISSYFGKILSQFHITVDNFLISLNKFLVFLDTFLIICKRIK
uniref:Ig-like domain-containing protein n=1 Tax=Stegastes partitus TaxID=144197 RepID=A0A3B4Z4E2_9TELE